MGNIYCLIQQTTGLMLTIASLANHTNLEETALVVKNCTEVNLIKKQTDFLSEAQKRKKRFLNAQIK